jgi:outer membrane lipoprotein-sorting protein
MSFLRRISTRQLLLLCAGVVALVIGGAALAIAAGTGGPKPPPKPLALAIRDALAAPAPPGVTARIKFTNHLIDSAGIEGSNPLLSGASGRLWATKDGRLRIELQSSKGDAQLVSDGKSFWAWDGSSSKVYRGRLPQHAAGGEGHRDTSPTLQQIERALARFGQHAAISGASPSSVAGRAAYTVRTSPKQHGGLLGGLEVAWDAARGLPLRLAVFAKGHSAPVLELKATDISFGPVSAGDFAVSPPAGVKTVDVSPSGHKPSGHKPSGHKPGGHERKARRARKGKELAAPAAVRKALSFKLAAPASLAGRTRQEVRALGHENRSALVTYGEGLDGIAVLEQDAMGKHTADTAGPLAQLPSISINGVHGQELVTPLGTVVRFERAGVTYTVLGSVPRAVAEAAARGL